MPVDLFEQHRAIQTAARDFLASLKRTPRITLDELSRSRAKLGGLLMQHQLAEQQQIFGPLLRDGGIATMPELEPIVRRIKLEKKNYSEMIRRWTPQTITADWDGYVAALAERLSEIPEMIRTEEEQIYKPVLRALFPTAPHGMATARAPVDRAVRRAG